MPVIVHLDSSYVGFIFLVVTELLLIRVVISSQIRSIDREVKNRLDDGQTVKLDIKEYGPLKITSHMGFSKIFILVFPAIFILLLVSTSELGISGRTLQTYSVHDTILSGGYFSLDSIKDSWDYIFEYDPSPVQFIGKWSSCVDFNNGDSVVAHRAVFSYEIIEENLILGDSICLLEDGDGVVISNLKSQCYEDDGTLYRFDYEVISKGDLVYKMDQARIGGVFGRSQVPQVSIWMGEYVSGECMGESGGPGKIFFVDTIDNVYAIMDDSWRIGNKKERWIIDVNIETSFREEESWDGTIQGAFTSIVECEKGCFEAIVEWLLSDGFDSGMENVFSYLTIWYEGLNYKETNPVCERNPHNEDEETSTNWIVDIDNLPFKTSSCDDVISREYIPDGGEENVTEISIWAVCFLSVSFFLTFLHYLFTMKGGYDLLSYEGISKLCYEDSNIRTWTKGGALSVCKLDGKITSRV